MPAALRLARFPLTPAARWWPWADSTGATSSGHGSAPLLYLLSRSKFLVPSFPCVCGSGRVDIKRAEYGVRVRP